MKRFIALLAYVLVIVGALNWGSWGFVKFDLVAWLFNGNTTLASRLIYVLIGLAGVLVLTRLPKVFKLISIWYGKSDADKGKECLACHSGQCSGKSLNPIVRFLVSTLVVIGALNWGLWGLFQFDLVAWVFNGNTAVLSRIVYAIVGVAGVFSLLAFGCTKRAISNK